MNISVLTSKWEVPNFKLFQQAWQDAACESNAASGFATTGVFPLDKCWVQNHSELFRLSEPFHDKAIEIHQIEARLEACDPADPSRARLQASLDAPALQQFRSPSQLSWTSSPLSTCASPGKSVCWSYKLPRSLHVLDLAFSQGRLDERCKDAPSMLPDDIFSTFCKVPTIKASSKKRRKKNKICKLRDRGGHSSSWSTSGAPRVSWGYLPEVPSSHFKGHLLQWPSPPAYSGYS